MAEMDESDFADMVEQTPVRTYVIEYREPSVDGRPGKLVGACLSRPAERRPVSMIYSFFDVGPSARKGLGTYIILDHIIRAARAACPTSISAIGSMARRAWPTRRSFRPLERLGRDGWRRMDEAERAAGRHRDQPAHPPRARAPADRGIKKGGAPSGRPAFPLLPRNSQATAACGSGSLTSSGSRST